jgi:YidC/Oxa1 family membrane protein insertase
MSTTTDRTQRMIFLALPFFFVAFVWQFPAGLLVYWITTNVWTIVQQAIVRRGSGRCGHRAEQES